MFCRKCQQFFKAVASTSKIPETIESPKDVQWTHYETVLHNSIRELKESSDARCPVCRAIENAPTIHERQGVFSNVDEPLDIVLYLEADKGPYPMLRVAYWDTNKVEKIARLPKQMIAACAGLVKSEELAATLDRGAELGNNSTGSDAAFELATFWLSDCVTNHDKCRDISPVGHLSFVPTRLIDVSNNAIKLVETANVFKEGDDRSYVSLSHCWGLIHIIRTLKENYEAHLQNIDPALLSKTFREAIHATRKLGQRYVWIDSLCIIQDDKSDWEKEAATMCDVYRNAVFKIAAAHAAGGDTGCFMDRDGLLHFPFVVDMPPSGSDPGSTKVHRFQFDSYGREQGLGGPEPPLYGRAWVLQEQLLSPRMLIYDGSQIRWECASGHGSENSPVGGLSRHIGHQNSIRMGIFNPAEFFHLPETQDEDFSARVQLQNWCYGVMDYTHRGMTQPSDRLVAIDGIAQALRRHTKREYYAGLWSEKLWIGLLWNIPHTNEYTPTTVGAFDMDRNKHARHKEEIAPSWSWASVTMPVVYPVPTIIYIDPICDILSTTVSGTAAKKSGRLEIRGHTRKGYIDAIYPYAIREAADVAPHMQSPPPNGRKDRIYYRGRGLHPTDHFIFSDTKPKTSSRATSKSSAGGLFSQAVDSWRLVRGTFRPDEVISPDTEITFIAIAQRNTGRKKGSLINTHEDSDPLQVWSLALVPTGKAEGGFRRVGYAEWEDCSWYGYSCGMRERPGREVEKGDGRGLMGLVSGLGDLENLGWRSMMVGGEGVKTHRHLYGRGGLPDLGNYQRSAGVEERVLIIV
ncbi:HET-domain-containing protein [Byssothecium circinans]|uniref:HET-domain-containing protein n=1 Tax=Byssothecium circinans TaxID=147558 RepID=A0A6A5TAZ7_9PLEO|nr:HET-domain-containing protein [Byssothecium circinans]